MTNDLLTMLLVGDYLLINMLFALIIHEYLILKEKTQ